MKSQLSPLFFGLLVLLLVGGFLLLLGRHERLKTQIQAQETLLRSLNIDETVELKGRIVLLENEQASLSRELEKSQQATETAKTELRRQLLKIDRGREELENRNQLLEESIARFQANKGTGKRDNDWQKSDSADYLTELTEINRLLRKYTEEGVMIVECAGISGQSLDQPVLHLDLFAGLEGVEFFPERAVFSATEEGLKLSVFGGHLLQTGQEKEEIPGQGLILATLTPGWHKEVLTPFLETLLGYQPGTEPGLADDANLSPMEKLREQINGLLTAERGDKYQFKKIDSVQGRLLLNVELEQLAKGGVLDKRIVANICELSLNKDHKTLELLFREGYLVQDGKDRPFYEGRFKLPIPQVDNQRWAQAGLDCLLIK